MFNLYFGSINFKSFFDLYIESNELFSKKWHTTAGAITYPVKYRPETGVFEKSLSLSGLVGFRKLLDKTKNVTSTTKKSNTVPIIKFFMGNNNSRIYWWAVLFRNHSISGII
jgi:hypothetical protein